MADTQFASDIPMTFHCDLVFDRGNLNVVPDIPSYFALPFCEV